MPAAGYTRMFENMVDHRNIHVELGVAYEDVVNDVAAERIIYTGPIDSFFEHCFGRLPYRSLRFDHQTLFQRRFQPVAVVNYPWLEIPYTRVTEYKHLTGQVHPHTSITYEYASDIGKPYYPVPRPRTRRCIASMPRWRTACPTLHSSAGLGHIDITTWIRWSARRLLPTAVSRRTHAR